jgi:hypothetical protein
VRKLRQQQAAGLGQSQTGRDEKLGEERIALAVAATPRRVLAAVGQTSSQSDVAKEQVAAKVNVSSIVPTRCALACPVRRDGDHGARTRRPPQRDTVAEGRGRDNLLFDGPAIKLVECSNAPIPARRRNAVWRVRQAPCPMKRQYIVAVGLPDRLAATAFAEEACPYEDVAGVGAPGVRRSRTHSRTGAEEAVELKIIAAVIHQDERHAVDQPGALGRVKRAGRNVHCETIYGKRARNSAKIGKI